MRKNTKKENEISAIDFVVVNQETAALVTEMLIDEDGMYKIKGRNETDHKWLYIYICNSLQGKMQEITREEQFGGIPPEKSKNDTRFMF